MSENELTKDSDDDDTVCLGESFFIDDNYELTTFTFGSHVLQLLCLQSASTDFDLTGQLVWPGARLLNEYLSNNGDLLQGCSAIELGSGVGVTGILCSRFCNEVVLTDHNDEVLKILKKNIDLHESSESALSAMKLEWGNTDHFNQILQKHPEGFDLVLGADIYILVFFVVIYDLLSISVLYYYIILLSFLSINFFFLNNALFFENLRIIALCFRIFL